MVRAGDVLRGVLLALVCCAGNAWAAVSVKYSAADLPDSVAGVDRWSYHYTLHGDFAPFESIELLFAPGAYATLELATPPDPSSFNATLVQPDTGLGADGLLTLNAEFRTITAAETFNFTVSFDWLTSGTPAEQPYNLYDPILFSIGSDSTTPVSEPSIWLLMLSALAAFPTLVRRAQAKP